MNSNIETSPAAQQPPDYKQIRKYLRTIDQREALGAFIKAGWTPAELAEYARQLYLVPGRTKPTSASYQFVVERGPEGSVAKQSLALMRAPGYIMPPFDRPAPKRFDWDDPDNPEHTLEIRSDVAEIARLWRNREADLQSKPWPEPEAIIPRWLWKRCFQLRNRYQSLEETVRQQQFQRYTKAPHVPG